MDGSLVPSSAAKGNGAMSMSRTFVIVVLVAVLSAACGGDDATDAIAERTDATTSTSPGDGSKDVASETTAPGPTSTAEGGSGATTTSSATTKSTTAPSTTAARPSTAQGERMTYAELYKRRQELVGRDVDVVGKVFFVANCPPPGDGPQQPCMLTGYLADPSRSELPPGDVDEAINLAEDGRFVSCSERESVDGGCSGWKHAQRYRVVATVEHQVLGGRKTQYIQLAVKTRAAA